MPLAARRIRGPTIALCRIRRTGLMPLVISPLHCYIASREAASCVRSHISPGPYRSFRELSLTGSVDPDIWCPPTFVGNSGIERSNGDRGFALSHYQRVAFHPGLAKSRMIVHHSKGDLRKLALDARDAMAPEARAAASDKLAARGLPFEIAPGTVVSGYSPIRNELDPAPLMRKLAALGAKLALPAVLGRGKTLVFRAWSENDRLMLGPLGILEPSPAMAQLIPDIMLVPLAAFDRLGHRIGYGAGHYDFTLAHLRKVKPITAIGLGFAAQEIKAVPALAHDVALDYVLTEKKAFDFRRI
jgi:5-formyltetrahydrofolate cyclo-ligase